MAETGDIYEVSLKNLKGTPSYNSAIQNEPVGGTGTVYPDNMYTIIESNIPYNALKSSMVLYGSNIEGGLGAFDGITLNSDVFRVITEAPPDFSSLTLPSATMASWFNDTLFGTGNFTGLSNPTAGDVVTQLGIFATGAVENAMIVSFNGGWFEEGGGGYTGGGNPIDEIYIGLDTKKLIDTYLLGSSFEPSFKPIAIRLVKNCLDDAIYGYVGEISGDLIGEPIDAPIS